MDGRVVISHITQMKNVLVQVAGDVRYINTVFVWNRFGGNDC